MSFAFATCDRRTALEHLRKLYPSSLIDDTDKSVKDLLDIVEADEIRICDPAFHGGQIIQGKNWRDDTQARAVAALRKADLWFAEK